MEHVKAVLETLNEAGMILNLDKCQFFVTEVRFLGHIVSAEGIRPDTENIAKVLQWPVPRMITVVRGFNNLANHYPRYIENFAGLAFPLTDLQKGSPLKGAAIEWTPGVLVGLRKNQISYHIIANPRTRRYVETIHPRSRRIAIQNRHHPPTIC